MTVKNEANAIGGLLASISAQTRAPDEVVIADGGSNDQTVSLIEAWGAEQKFPVRVIAAPGANISQGRNAAIRAASGEIIASTDAGVRLDPRWLEKLLEPIEGTEGRRQKAEGTQMKREQQDDVTRHPSPVTCVVSGFFLPDPQTVFEMAMSAAVLPSLAEIDPRTFLPSSRSVAFGKAAWQAVGGYPEWLDYCEDLVFDFALRKHYAFVFAPDALAYFRPRGSLRAFFRQYYLYARGDGKADLWRKRHLIRYLTYLVAAPSLIVLSVFHSPLWLLMLGAGAAAYLFTPYRRLVPYLARMNLKEKCYTVMLVPIIRVSGDVAKMMGYPVGVVVKWSAGRVVS